MAAVIGSVTLDGFVTGKADLSAANTATLARTAENIKTLLQHYPASTIHVIGHTDAVGQEGDNQTLGESRAESVKAALQQMGIPEIVIHSDSHGARELLVRTTKAEARNRRVQVYFEPSLIGRQALIGQAESSGGGIAYGTFQPGGAGTRDCISHPERCLGPGGSGIGGSPKGAPLKSTPGDISLKGMDVKGINDAYLSHGNRPPSGDDVREAWTAAKKKYLGLGTIRRTCRLAGQQGNLEHGKQRAEPRLPEFHRPVQH